VIGKKSWLGGGTSKGDRGSLKRVEDLTKATHQEALLCELYFDRRAGQRSLVWDKKIRGFSCTDVGIVLPLTKTDEERDSLEKELESTHHPDLDV